MRTVTIWLFSVKYSFYAFFFYYGIIDEEHYLESIVNVFNHVNFVINEGIYIMEEYMWGGFSFCFLFSFIIIFNLVKRNAFDCMPP